MHVPMLNVWRTFAYIRYKKDDDEGRCTCFLVLFLSAGSDTVLWARLLPADDSHCTAAEGFSVVSLIYVDSRRKTHITGVDFTGYCLF